MASSLSSCHRHAIKSREKAGDVKRLSMQLSVSVGTFSQPLTRRRMTIVPTRPSLIMANLHCGSVQLFLGNHHHHRSRNFMVSTQTVTSHLVAHAAKVKGHSHRRGEGWHTMKHGDTVELKKKQRAMTFPEEMHSSFPRLCSQSYANTSNFI